MTIFRCLPFILCLALAPSETPSVPTPPPIELLFDPARVGEQNQVMGIQEALLTELKGAPLKKELVIASGNFGIYALLKLLPTQKFLVHSSHQWTSDEEKLIGKVDLVVLPKHALTDEIRKKFLNSKTVLLETIGVSHNLTLARVNEQFETLGPKIPLAKTYFTVILGGDSQNSDSKTWKFYTPQEVLKLAEYVEKEVGTDSHKVHLIVINGPRTGMYDPRTKKINDKAHRGEMDSITKEFCGYFAKRKIGFSLYDFQYDRPSYYQALLGFLSQPVISGNILVPGESTSMVSETIDIIGPQRVVVYQHEAMNETHKKHAEDEWRTHRIKALLNKNFQAETIPQDPVENTMLDSAAKTVAKKILSLQNS